MGILGRRKKSGDVALACRAPVTGFIETTRATPTGPTVFAFMPPNFPHSPTPPHPTPRSSKLPSSHSALPFLEVYHLLNWSLLPHSLKTLAPGSMAFTLRPWPQFLPTASWMTSLSAQTTHPIPCLSISWPYILQWLSPLLSPITSWLCHHPKLHLLNHKPKHPKLWLHPLSFQHDWALAPLILPAHSLLSFLSSHTSYQPYFCQGSQFLGKKNLLLCASSSFTWACTRADSWALLEEITEEGQRVPYKFRLSHECMLLGSLSRHNKNLEWRTLKLLGGSQLSEDRPCYSS